MSIVSWLMLENLVVNKINTVDIEMQISANQIIPVEGTSAVLWEIFVETFKNFQFFIIIQSKINKLGRGKFHET